MTHRWKTRTEKEKANFIQGRIRSEFFCPRHQNVRTTLCYKYGFELYPHTKIPDSFYLVTTGDQFPFFRARP